MCRVVESVEVGGWGGKSVEVSMCIRSEVKEGEDEKRERGREENAFWGDYNSQLLSPLPRLPCLASVTDPLCEPPSTSARNTHQPTCMPHSSFLYCTFNFHSQLCWLASGPRHSTRSSELRISKVWNSTGYSGAQKGGKG